GWAGRAQRTQEPEKASWQRRFLARPGRGGPARFDRSRAGRRLCAGALPPEPRAGGGARRKCLSRGGALGRAAGRGSRCGRTKRRSGPAMTAGELTEYMLRDDGVALLRLDRPDARNAMNTALLNELLARIATAAADDGVRVLVFSTTSPQALSAGADVREQLDQAGHVARMELFAELYEAVVNFPRPTVAVCVGNAVGGGAELAI